jgi:hypothetical protein
MRCIVTKDELIVKQQLEIEELKLAIDDYKNTCNAVRGYLWGPEQWSIKCPDFPKVAMTGIVQAMRAVDDV